MSVVIARCFRRKNTQPYNFSLDTPINLKFCGFPALVGRILKIIYGENVVKAVGVSAGHTGHISNTAYQICVKYIYLTEFPF